MKRMKRLTALVLTLCMLFTLAPIASAANGTIKMTLNSNTMTVNGVNKAIDSDPAIKSQVKKDSQGNGYTMLPLRAVVEAMGGTVAYDAATKVITMTYNGTTVKHTIGTKTATVNGVSKTMAIASYAANNRTYVHLRAIELLSASIKVDWVASSQSVTITYPQTTASNGIKTVNLTIKNSCATSYLQFTALQLAPAGSTTYSGNLLNGTLILGGTRVLNMSIQPGKYDLKGTDINGNTFTWKNLDFSQVQSSAVLTLTSGALYTLSIDNALTGTASSNVTVYNNTGAIITKIQAFQSTSTTPTEVYSGNLYSGSYTQIPLPYGTGNNVYYLTVTFANGGQITYNYITVDGSYMTIALRGDGTFTYGGVTTGDGVYFVNRTGSNIKTLYMKLGSGGAWSADLVDGTLKSGDYIELPGVSTAELRNMTVYFRTTSSGSGKNVEVASSLKNSIVFYYGSSLGVEYNVDPSDVTYEEGLYIENDTDADIEFLRVLVLDEVYNKYNDDDEEEVIEDWEDNHLDYFFKDSENQIDGEDYDASDFYEEIDDIEVDDYVFTDEWDAEDLSDAKLLFEVKFVGDSDYYYDKISLDDDWDYNAYITIEGYNDSDDSLDLEDDYDFVEDEWEVDLDKGLLIYNSTSKDIDYLYLSDSASISASDVSDRSNLASHIDEELTNIDSYEYEVSDIFDRYSDISGKTIHYYIKFENGNIVKGDVEINASTSKKNACIIVDSYSNNSDKRYDVERDWYDDDYYYSDLETGVYLYNNSGVDNITKVKIYIGGSSFKTYEDLDVDKGEYLELDDVDFDDIDAAEVYFKIYFDGGSSNTTRTRDVVDLDDYYDADDEIEYENVVFKIGEEASSSSSYDYKMSIDYNVEDID